MGVTAISLFVSLSLGAGSTSFTAQDGMPGIVLTRLVEEALNSHPEVLAAQKRWEAARLRPAPASSLPETVVSVGYSGAGSPLPFAGIGREPTSNIGWMVTQEMPFPGKRQLRGAVKDKEAEITSAQFDQVRLDVAGRVKRAYYRWAFSRRVQRILQVNRSVLEEMSELSRIRYAAGQAPQQDVLRLQTELALLDTRVRLAEADQRAAVIELEGLIGRSGLAGLQADPEDGPPQIRVPLENMIHSFVETSPTLRVERRSVERADSQVNLARKDVYPDYALSAGYFFMGRMPDMFQLRVDLRLPTSFFRKQRVMVAEQVVLREESRRNLEAVARSSRTRIAERYLAAETALAQIDSYKTTLIPQAELSLEAGVNAYETGSVDLVAVFSSFIGKLEFEVRLEQEVLNARLALIDIEAITGRQP